MIVITWFLICYRKKLILHLNTYIVLYCNIKKTMQSYTFQIIGNAGVGKTKYIDNLSGGHGSSVEWNNQPLHYSDNHVFITAACSQPNTDVDGLLLMFDLHNPKSFDDIEKYFGINKPKVLVGTKQDDIVHETDDPEQKWYVKKWRELQNNGTNMHFYEVSSVSGYNVEQPIQKLLESQSA